MESEPVQYTPEELKELFEIIFLGHPREDSLVLMDLYDFKDCDSLKKELDKEIPYIKKRDQYQDVKEVLFCDKSKLPLMLKHPFYKVVHWRLEHGR